MYNFWEKSWDGSQLNATHWQNVVILAAYFILNVLLVAAHWNWSGYALEWVNNAPLPEHARGVCFECIKGTTGYNECVRLSNECKRGVGEYFEVAIKTYKPFIDVPDIDVDINEFRSINTVSKKLDDKYDW